MSKINSWLEKLIANSLALLMAAIVITVLWQVFSRYILQSPSASSEEISRFLLIWLGILGAVYCYLKNSHLSLDLLAQKLSDNGKIKLTVFCDAIVLIFSFMSLVIGGQSLISVTLDPVQTSAILGIKFGAIYSIVPIAGVLFSFIALTKIADSIGQLAKLKKEPSHGV